MSKNTPDVDVKYVIKDNTEWKEFVDSVCRSYGFEKKTCPLVYTLEGTLIGDGSDFITHCHELFDKTVTVTKEMQKNRQKLNVQLNDERMRKKKEGDTLGEKIEKQMGKIAKKRVAQLIDDAFYQHEIERGVKFQVRRTNFYRMEPSAKLSYGRIYDVPDENLIR